MSSSGSSVRDLTSLTIGFVGGGNMALAIAAGLINKGVIKPDQVIVSATNLEGLRNRWSPLAVGRFTTENADVIRAADIVFLCVKPQILPVFVRSVQNKLDGVDCREKILVSILAGITLNRLHTDLAFLNINHVRTMPNTPMQVGAGCTIYCEGFDPDCPKIVRERYEDIKFMLGQLGMAYEVKEDLINGVGGLTGCGPAFVYQIIEAFSDAAVKQGLPRDRAIRMAAQTVMGAAKTVLDTGKHPAVLKDEVCSPGGATIHGVHELEKGALRATLINAVEKAAARAKELQ